MEYLGPVVIILICGLFADSLLIRDKLRDQDRRISDLEKSLPDS